MRYVANKDTKEFHDREHEDPRCNLAELKANVDNVVERAMYDEMIAENFTPCGWCIGEFAKE